jgi:gluconokinase
MVAIVVMGVCGSGKTTVAQALASKLHCTFRDADEFHSDENKQKMSSGLPLTDEDRIPWLLAIHNYIKRLLDSKDTGIVTCSSLKQWYRHILITGDVCVQNQTNQLVLQRDVLFVHLKGRIDLIKDRLKQRSGHFMPPKLLQSQLDTLEEPSANEYHITLDIEKSVEEMVIEVIRFIS